MNEVRTLHPTPEPYTYAMHAARSVSPRPTAGF